MERKNRYAKSSKISEAKLRQLVRLPGSSGELDMAGAERSDLAE